MVFSPSKAGIGKKFGLHAVVLQLTKMYLLSTNLRQDEFESKVELWRAFNKRAAIEFGYLGRLLGEEKDKPMSVDDWGTKVKPLVEKKVREYISGSLDIKNEKNISELVAMFMGKARRVYELGPRGEVVSGKSEKAPTMEQAIDGIFKRMEARIKQEQSVGFATTTPPPTRTDLFHQRQAEATKREEQQAAEKLKAEAVKEVKPKVVEILQKLLSAETKGKQERDCEAQLRELEKKEENKVAKQQIREIRQQLESLRVLKEMRTGITDEEKERRRAILRDNVILKGDQALMDLMERKMKERHIEERFFKPRTLAGKLHATDVLGPGMENKKGKNVAPYGHGRLKITVTRDPEPMEIRGEFQVGIDKIRGERKLPWRTKANFVKKIDTEMDRFITHAINEYGKGTDANPFNIAKAGNEKYPELQFAALMKIKEKAILSGETFIVTVSDGAGKTKNVEIGPSEKFTEDERKAFETYAYASRERTTKFTGKKVKMETSVAESMLASGSPKGVDWDDSGAAMQRCQELIIKRVKEKEKGYRPETSRPSKLR